MKYVKIVNTKIGKISIIEEDEKIIRLYVNKNIDQNDILEKNTNLLLNAENQIKQYLDGKREKFDLPIKQEGTEFMQNVWKQLLKIPYGETRSYKQIAQNIGNPKAVRAIGMANNKNKIPIIVPCHRVIGSNGGLVGYDLGLEVKKWLLDLESKNKNNFYRK